MPCCSNLQVVQAGQDNDPLWELAQLDGLREFLRKEMAEGRFKPQFKGGL